MSKTITFSTLKGGVGKTTLAYQFGYYLAKKPDTKVLMIDLDNQEKSDLSTLMKPYLTDEQIAKANISDVFDSEIKNNDVENTGVTPQKLDTPDDTQLYGLISDSRLIAMKHSLVSKNKGNGVSLVGYLYTQGYSQEFDYIIIDTHPDLEDVYVNGAMICSDDVFAPVEPSKFGMGSIVDMSDRFRKLKAKNVSSLERKPMIAAKLHWVGNRIDFTSSESFEFLKAIRQSNNFTAYFHTRTAFNKSNFTGKYVINYLDSKEKPTIGDKRAKKEILAGFKNMEATVSSKASVRSEE